MKTRIILLFIIISIICEISIKAQCGIAQLSIKDTLTIKALKGYIDNVKKQDPMISLSLVNKKTQIVLVSVAPSRVIDGYGKKTLRVGICDNNYYKHNKMIVNGYFYLDDILFLLTSDSYSSFQTVVYDYSCMDRTLSNYNLKEYNPPKRIKVMRNNAEAEIVDLGDKRESFGCVIILGVNTEDKDKGYQLLYEL
jgi:hypothetical protein